MTTKKPTSCKTGPPSPNGHNGRGASGRFAKGNPGGPGNPHAQQVGKLRSAMLRAVTEADVKAIVARLVKLAKEGNVQAAREVLDRCVGKPTEADLIARIEQLERVAEARER